MRQLNEISNKLFEYNIRKVELFNIAMFLQRIGKADIEFIPSTNKDAKMLSFEQFKAWYYECEPNYNVGDIVRISRENIDNPCNVVGIKIELDSKPYGCYLKLRSIQKNTEQWVNQRNVELIK